MKALHTAGLLVVAAIGLGCIAFAAGKEDAKLARPKGTLTFTKDIAPILYKNCAGCHRAGEVAPFTLTSYEDAKKRAKQIAYVTENKTMPPWHAEEKGVFHDERRLTSDEIALLKQWADEGAKPGNSPMPEPPVFPNGWSLGEPDVILELPKPFSIPAEGSDVYRCFVLPNSFTEDKNISAIEVRPGNAKVVHHVIAFLNSDGKARKIQEENKDGQPGYSSFGGIGANPSGTLGGWAPGNYPRHLPENIGIALPRGTEIVLQIHYHPTGKVETDNTKIGLYFSKKPVEKHLKIFPVAAMLNIPPGEANYTTKSFPIPLPFDVTVIGVLPHMHLLGKEMKLTAKMPDGSEKSLVNVPKYSFDWQTTYYYKEPVRLKRGTVINMVARYDNSSSNPRNPSNPPKRVGWGEGTNDEMALGFVFFTLDAENLKEGKKGSLGNGSGRGGLLQQLFNRNPQNN